MDSEEAKNDRKEKLIIPIQFQNQHYTLTLLIDWWPFKKQKTITFRSRLKTVDIKKMIPFSMSNLLMIPDL